MKTLNKIVASAVAGLMIASMAFVCIADGAPKVTAVRASTENVYFYLKGDHISSFNVQIGDSVCRTEQTDLNMRTLILIDSSVSVYETLVAHSAVSAEARAASVDTPISIRDSSGAVRENDTLTPFLNTIVDNRSPNESFRIGMLSDKVDYLCSWSNDPNVVKNSFSNISFYEQDTHIIRYLYNLVSSSGTDGVYQRILLITDGNDDNFYARNYEELCMIENSKQVPLFILGINTGDSSSPIWVNLASYVRSAPNGKYINTTDGSNLGSMLSALNDDHSMQAFVATPNKNIFIGSEMGAIVHMTTDYGDFTATPTVKLPVRDLMSDPVITSTPEVTPTSEMTDTPGSKPSVPTEETAPTGETLPEGEDTPSSAVGIIDVLKVVVLVIILVLLVAGFIIYFTRTTNFSLSSLFGKKTSTHTVSEDSQLVAVKNRNRVVPIEKRTEKKMKKVYTGSPADAVPVAPVGTVSLSFYNLNDPADIRIVELKETLTVGQDPSCNLPLTNDGSLAAIHCIFFLKNNEVYLRDNNTVNKTYFNGVAIESADYQIPPSGGVLRIGRSEFNVYIERN